MNKLALGFCLTLALSSFGFAADSNLGPVHQRLYGNSLLNPSPTSNLGKYLRATHAQTILRSFPKGPADGNSPVQEGVQKLVVAVSPQTFPKFLKYFSSINYLMINSMYMMDHIQPAYRGKSAVYAPPFSDQLSFSNEGVVMIPVLLDDQEAGRFITYLDTMSEFGIQSWSQDVYSGPGLIYPERITTLNGSTFFPGNSGFATSCASWFPNLPIGNKLTYTYYFPSGNDETPAIAQNLVDYKLPDPEKNQLMHKVYQVPGHQQLGDILNRPSLGRGEFHNGGWIIYTLLGSVGMDRTPVVFLQVDDVTKPIDRNFNLNIEAE